MCANVSTEHPFQGMQHSLARAAEDNSRSFKDLAKVAQENKHSRCYSVYGYNCLFLRNFLFEHYSSVNQLTAQIRVSYIHSIPPLKSCAGNPYPILIDCVIDKHCHIPMPFHCNKETNASLTYIGRFGIFWY